QYLIEYTVSNTFSKANYSSHIVYERSRCKRDLTTTTHFSHQHSNTHQSHPLPPTMPRQNCYHPYSRSTLTSSTSKPSLHSPRPPPTPRLPNKRLSTSPFTSIPESPPDTSSPTQPSARPTSTPAPYQYINPAYIRTATTFDGHELVTRSLILCPDGSFCAQMEMVRYPQFLGDEVCPIVDIMGSVGKPDVLLGAQGSVGMPGGMIPGSGAGIGGDCAILSEEEDEDADADGEVDEGVFESGVGEVGEVWQGRR
ncbi:hypothetical protein EJ04DRAFT_360584, partial [Polyplosphaeria fusca]